MTSERLSLWLLLGTCALAGLLAAQTFQASVTGVVRDLSSAVVPNVQVTATDLATGAKFTAMSNESGIYRFPVLPPATYRITATMQGFRTFEQGPITLQV